MEIVVGKGARICSCRVKQIREKQINAIPQKFRHAVLEKLTPDVTRHAKQPMVLAEMKRSPEKSYFLAGRPNTGKSMMMWALYRHAVESGKFRVICCTLSDLLEEYRQVFQALQMNERPSIPRLTVERLSQKGQRYAVFLDDIDKANVTEYVAEQVYRIVNAIYENEHILVVTTNKSVAGLIEQYDRRDETRGEPIVRRMLDGSVLVELF